MKPIDDFISDMRAIDVSEREIKEIFSDDVISLFNDQHHASDQNNGLITRIWGPSTWISVHSISFGYPIKPTDEQKNDYYNYYVLLGKVLPCIYCRQSYSEFITTEPTKLTMNIMKSRYTLAYWLYKIHQRVNNKLGVDYKVSFRDVLMRYETFRARCNSSKTSGCLVPLDYKSKSYQKLNYQECVVINKRHYFIFRVYGMMRGIKTNEFERELKKVGYNLDDMINKDIWIERNKKCRKIIKKMRAFSVPSIESDGEWKGMPTIFEMELLMRLSSNMSKEEMESCVNNLLSDVRYIDFNSKHCLS